MIMKKIFKLIASLAVLFSVTSCDLTMDPPLSTDVEEAYTLEYCNGLRGYVYGDIKALMSGSFHENLDLFVDELSVCISAGNQGYFIFNWFVYPTTSEVDSYWSSYFTTIMHINYSIKHMQETIDQGIQQRAEIEKYIGEMYFFRAYVMHQAALLFCEDYDPDQADTQLGLPYPLEWNPDAKMARGTLKALYEQVEKDLKQAELVVDTEGSQNAIYLTKDAITAFRAQLALYLHQYDAASQYASSLYGAYPLINGEAYLLERMWFEDNSTENILQLDVLKETMSSVLNYADYLNASYMDGEYWCSPYYVPEKWLVDLYADGDIRKGIYIGREHNGIPYVLSFAGYYTNLVTPTAPGTSGWVINKFRGNKNFQSTQRNFSYRTSPKIFRIADMYLIDAEAQYQLNGGGLEPLNTLRQSRGLAALGSEVTGEALWTEIQNERAREFIGEGTRLFELKRWNKGFTRSYQNIVGEGGDNGILLIDVNSYRQTFKVEPGVLQFVWPIPLSEMAQNPKMEQNPGY